MSRSRCQRAPVVLPWLLLLLLGWCGLEAQGAVTYNFSSTPGSGIEVESRCPFDMTGINGMTPVRIRIKNGSGTDGRWSLRFESPGSSYSRARSQQVTTHYSAGVRAGQEREFTYLVPMAVADPYGYLSGSLRLTVDGLAVNSITQNFPAKPSAGGGRSVGMNGVSEKFLGAQGPDLQKALKAASRDPKPLTIDTTMLPPDWRALAGFDQIWITTGEWERLTADVRLAMEQWVAMGGVLHRAEPGASAPVQSLGLGRIEAFPLAADGTVELDRLTKQMGNLGHLYLQEALGSYFKSWPDPSWVPAHSGNAPLLVVVIVLFGVVVGPVNFFILAGKEKRARIFWLTPLISLVGTVIIGASIFIQDGLGGWGRRVALVVLQPDRHSEVILQEQASKTGALFSAGFQLDKDVLLRQLPISPRGLKFQIEGARHEGDWFLSRSVQGQLLAAVRPTRAGIQVVNAGEVAAGKAPRIISQIAETLDELSYVNADGQEFVARGVSPGRETVMQPGNAQGMVEFQRAAGPFLEQRARVGVEQRGWFRGFSKKARNIMIPTLGVIRWTDDWALFLCPANPTP